MGIWNCRRIRGKFKNVRHLRMEMLERRDLLTIWTVNTNLDENDGVGVGNQSLRDVIIAAAPAGDEIRFATNLNGATIALTHGEISFDKTLTIDASMLSQGITIRAYDPDFYDTSHGPIAGNGERIFNIIDTSLDHIAPPTVTLKNLKLTGGDMVLATRAKGARFVPFFFSTLELPIRLTPMAT